MSPDLELFFSMPWHVQLHAIAAMGALGLGVVQFVAPKGTVPHRALGYVWVILMAVTATTAIFIRQINEGGFSPIHLFIPLTLYAIVELSIRGRKGLTGKHRRTALGVFFGALIVPGLFSFLPGRLMWHVFFGA